MLDEAVTAGTRAREVAALLGVGLTTLQRPERTSLLTGGAVRSWRWAGWCSDGSSGRVARLLHLQECAAAGYERVNGSRPTTADPGQPGHPQGIRVVTRMG